MPDVRGVRLDRSLIQPVLYRNEGLRASRPSDTSLNVQKISNTLKIEMPNIIQGLERFKALRDCGYAEKLKELSLNE